MIDEEPNEWNTPNGPLMPFIALAIAGLVWLVSSLVACGSLRVEAPKPLPPNVEQACDRALHCGAILDGQHDACVACLEHVNTAELERLRVDLGDLPPLDSVSCDTIKRVVSETNLGFCVAGRWYGP